LKGDKVILINKGLANNEGKQVPFGKSFITCLNKKTGDKFYTTFLPEEFHVLDYKMNKDTLILLSSKSVIRFNTETGEEIDSKTYKNENEEFVSFLKTNDYIVNQNDSIIQIEKNSQEQMLIYTNLNSVISYDPLSDFSTKERNVEIFKQYKNLGKYKLIRNKNKMLVLDKYDRKYLILNVPIISNIIDKKLYCISENQYFKIDLSNLLIDK
jgi:hypothetical protein